MRLQTIKYNTEDAYGYATFFKGLDGVYYVIEFSHETPAGNGVSHLEFIGNLIMSIDVRDDVITQFLSDADIWGDGRDEDIIISN
jgi:hypothetical protein